MQCQDGALLHTVGPDTRSLEELLSDARERAQQLHRGKEGEVSKQTGWTRGPARRADGAARVTVAGGSTSCKKGV